MIRLSSSTLQTSLCSASIRRDQKPCKEYLNPSGFPMPWKGACSISFINRLFFCSICLLSTIYCTQVRRSRQVWMQRNSMKKQPASKTDTESCRCPFYGFPVPTDCRGKGCCLCKDFCTICMIFAARSLLSCFSSKIRRGFSSLYSAAKTRSSLK